MLSVGGKPSGRVRETVTRQIQSAETVVAGQPSLLQLKLPGATSSILQWYYWYALKYRIVFLFRDIN